MNLIDPELPEQCVGHTIKVTYDAFYGLDTYVVIGIDSDDQIIIKRPQGKEFTVSRSWFTRPDTGRNIEIIN